ncbi:MAG: M48 family metalloprotease [Planctomycetales bacterium]
MSKPSWPVVVGLLIVGGGIVLAVTVAVIRSEGNRMRETIKTSADEAVQQNVDSVIRGAGDEVRGVLRTAVDAAGEVISGKATTDPDGVLEDIKDILAGRGRPGEEPGGDKGAKEKQATILNPVDLIGDFAKIGQAVAKTMDDVAQDVLKLESSEEKQLGKEVHATICQQHKLLDVPRIVRSLERLAAPLLQGRHRRDLTFTFSVIDDDSENAFSHLGGYVYVNRGLLELAKSDVELQFVLGHEIAHVDLGHCVSQLTYAARTSQVAGQASGGLVQLAYHAIALGYSEDKEFAADIWAYDKLRGLGVTHEQVLAFPRRMLDEMNREGLDTEPQKPDTTLGSTVQEIENHFRSHPPMPERIARLEAMWNKSSSARKP